MPSSLRSAATRTPSSRSSTRAEAPSRTPAPSAAPKTLLSLSDLHAWLGLKSSDDQGTQFDFRADVAKNGVPVGSSTTRCITGVTRSPDLAKEVTGAFDVFAPIPVAPGDIV